LTKNLIYLALYEGNKKNVREKRKIEKGI